MQFVSSFIEDKNIYNLQSFLIKSLSCFLFLYMVICKENWINAEYVNTQHISSQTKCLENFPWLEMEKNASGLDII